MLGLERVAYILLIEPSKVKFQGAPCEFLLPRLLPGCEDVTRTHVRLTELVLEVLRLGRLEPLQALLLLEEEDSGSR